jgi:hypothetical protein
MDPSRPRAIARVHETDVGRSARARTLALATIAACVPFAHGAWIVFDDPVDAFDDLYVAR